MGSRTRGKLKDRLKIKNKVKKIHDNKRKERFVGNVLISGVIVSRPSCEIITALLSV